MPVSRDTAELNDTENTAHCDAQVEGSPRLLDLGGTLIWSSGRTIEGASPFRYTITFCFAGIRFRAEDTAVCVNRVTLVLPHKLKHTFCNRPIDRHNHLYGSQLRPRNSCLEGLVISFTQRAVIWVS